MAKTRKFKKGFLWGTSSSGFQTEMGGSPEHIDPNTDWFRWCRDERNIKEKRVSGDLPENGPAFWRYFREDIARAAKELKNNAIRLGIEWSRIFPESTEEIRVDVERDERGNILGVRVRGEHMKALEEMANARAVQKYREIFKEANKQGLAVLLTLNHFSLPEWLHDPIKLRDGQKTDKLGWVDQKTAVEFAKYSAFVAKAFGDLVDLWATMNEPMVLSRLSYIYPKAGYPPGIVSQESFIKVCKNLATAHALAYRQIKEWDKKSVTDFGPSYVGVIVDLIDYQPYDSKKRKDVEAARSHWYLFNEWFLNAIFRGEFDMDADGVTEKDGVFPELARSCDYLGVNYYMRLLAKSGKSGFPLLKGGTVQSKGSQTDMGWGVYPPGIRHVVTWAYRRYRCPIILTENGMADEKDRHRKTFIIQHLRQLHKAVEGGVPVLGYFYWSLIDNLEWPLGFRPRLGLYTIDYKTKERKATRAVPTYRKICEDNVVP